MLSKKKKKKNNEKKIAIKLILSLIYTIVITVLSVSAYQIFKEKQVIKSWAKITDVNEYSYIEVSKMSEKCLCYKKALRLSYRKASLYSK